MSSRHYLLLSIYIILTIACRIYACKALVFYNYCQLKTENTPTLIIVQLLNRNINEKK